MNNFGQHLLGIRMEARHACPGCPTPLTAVGTIYIPPSPNCPYCQGSGSVDEATLARYQREWNAANPA
jgi:hypothetical protein